MLPLHTPTEKNSTIIPPETCQDQLTYIGFGVGIGVLIIGLVLGTIIGSTLCLKQRSEKETVQELTDIVQEPNDIVQEPNDIVQEPNDIIV